MPTSIARIGREKKLRTLANKLFVIEGADKAEKLRRAERALLRANPALAREDAFRPGAVVLVPADIGLAPRERVERPGSDLKGLLQESAQRLQMAQTAAKNGFARAQAADEESLSRLDNRNFIAKLRKASSEAVKLAQSARPAIKERRDLATRREEDVSKAIDAAMAEIDRLQRLFRPG